MIHRIVLSHSRPGVSHISLRPHKIQPGGWEKKNKRTNTDLGQLQAQEREVCVTILCSFLCICRLSRACILRETSTKPRGMLTHLWLCSLTASFCRPSSLVSYLKPTVLLCPALSTDSLCLLWDLPSLLHFRSHGRSHPQSFVWVSRQNRQRDHLSGTNTNETNCYALCHILTILYIFVYLSSM